MIINRGWHKVVWYRCFYPELYRYEGLVATVLIFGFGSSLRTFGTVRTAGNLFYGQTMCGCGANADANAGTAGIYTFQYALRGSSELYVLQL